MKTSVILLSAQPVVSAAAATAARETPECRIEVLRPVTDDNGRRWRAGEIAAAAVIRRDGRKNIFSCEDHGQRLPQTMSGVAATRPIHCRPGKTTGSGYASLDPDPAVMGAGPAPRMPASRRAGNRLSAAGVSDASAGGLAETSASAPASREGRLVAMALAGSTAALGRLKRANP